MQNEMNKKRLPLLDDFAMIHSVSEPAYHSKSKRLVYVESGWDETKQCYFSKIRSSGEECITVGGNKEERPAFSTDGRFLYFLSDASGESQLYRYDLENKKADKLTTMRNGVSYYRISPNERKVALVTYKYNEDDMSELLTELSDEERRRNEADMAEQAWVIEHRGYRQNGIHGIRRRKTKLLYVLDLESGSVKYLCGNENDVTDPAWMPDSSEILMIGDEDDGFTISRIDIQSGEFDIVLCDETLGISDGYSPALVTSDGQTIVFTAEIAEESELSHSSLYMISAIGGKAVRLLDSLTENDGAIPAMEISAYMANEHSMVQLGEHDECVYYVSSFGGEANIYRVPLFENSVPQQVTKGPRYFQGIEKPCGDKLLGVCGDSTSLPYIAEINLNDGSVTALAEVNSWMKEVPVSASEPFWTKTADGAFDLQGWILKPYDFSADKKYSVLVYVHGGPKVHFGCAMNYELQCMAAEGIGVIYCNPRGSTGYGKKFADDDAAWDGRAFDDVMTFLDAVIAENPWIDENRLGIGGKSYGGYMSVWAASHSDRFKAASAQSAMVSESALYASSDCSVSDYSDEDRSLTEFLAEYIDKSPVAYADRIQSALLILQGDNDFRCPVPGAYQLFRAVKEYHPDVPAKLVLFPDSDHGMTYDGPMYIKLRFFNENLAWFKKYL